jgi:RNA polymerase sigma-70 factor (ECF subfamily)
MKKHRHQSAQKRNSGYDLCLDELSSILPGENMEDALDARAFGQSINRFLAVLSKTDRILFLRRYWFGDRVKDLARQQRMTENALSVRLARLRQKCKDHLIKEGFWDEA